MAGSALPGTFYTKVNKRKNNQFLPPVGHVGLRPLLGLLFHEPPNANGETTLWP
jgi:hypothetical protein